MTTDDADASKINSNGALQGLFDEIEKRLSRLRAMAVVAVAAAQEELQAEYWLLAEDLAAEAATALEKLHEKVTASGE